MAEYKKGDVVQHDAYGIGTVSEPVGDRLAVRFGQETRMVAMDDGRMRPIHPQGFLCMRHANPAALRDLVRNDPVRAIVLLIGDLPGGSMRTPDIREHLEPFVEDWSSWWSNAQKAVIQDPRIDTSRSREGIYALAERPVAHTEGLFRRMRIIVGPPDAMGAANVTPEALEIARSILVQEEKSPALSPEARQGVQGYLQRIIALDGVPVAERTDLLLRMLALGWLREREAQPVLLELCQQPIRIYALSAFAARRVVDPLLALGDSPGVDDSLLTAFAADPRQLGVLRDAYLARGQGAALERGLYLGLVENMPEASGADAPQPRTLRDWYERYAARIWELGRTLDILVVEARVAIDWPQLASHLEQTLRHLSDLGRIAEPPTSTLNALGGLFRRCLAYASSEGVDHHLRIAALVPLRSSITHALLETLFLADPARHLVDRWAALAQSLPEEQLLPLLDAAAGLPGVWDKPLDGVAYLLERFPSSPAVRTWAVGRLAATYAGENAEVLQAAGLLEQLHSGDLPPETRAMVDELRAQAAYEWCRAVEADQEAPDVRVVLDATSARGLARHLADVEATSTAALSAERDKTAAEKHRVQDALERLAQTEASLEELRKSYRQPTAEAAFVERKRILEAIVATVAEFNRFATRMGSKELEGVVRRLHSVLKGLGAEPFGSIGEVVTFDPARHELVAAGSTAAQDLRVVERGYYIMGPDGSHMLLRPAKVGPQ
ncbi:MAG: hypothetical protein GX657_02160 [Chloroflexi bacterium]|nr:hypothetical protein [Chloroflexota bacterium]